MRTVLFIVALPFLVLIGLPAVDPTAHGHDGECGRPVTHGLTPVVTDCLFTLRVTVGIGVCHQCICDMDGDGGVDTTDALRCLRAAVGIGVALDCPACDVTTTTFPAPTTTLALPTTTTLAAPTTTTLALPTTTTSTVVTTSTTLALPVCGNGSLDGTEECDDGNAAGGDGCASDCTLEDERGLCAGVPVHTSGSPAAVLLTSDLARPVDIQAPPLDPRRLFVVEQAGLVRLILDGAPAAEPFLDLSNLVSCCGERGLLGLAFDPSYGENRRFFVNYTDKSGATVVARYLRSQNDLDRADPASGNILFVVPQPQTNHNAGQLAFGPDGYLYVAMGDGGGAGDPLEAAQDPTNLLGKMLRLDVDVDGPPFFATPPDNPDPGAEGLLSLVWASGLRNPWRYSFDALTGDLYIADVGQGSREEVNVIPAGSPAGLNFGWDVFEGTQCFEPQPLAPDCASLAAGMQPPVLDYGRGDGRSVTGGYVYRGCALAFLRGTYFYADYASDFIRTFELVGGQAVNRVDRTAELDPPGFAQISSISTFGLDARGELYVADHIDGELFKIVAE